MTTTEQIEYLDSLIQSALDWADHIGQKPDQTEISALYAEIKKLEGSL